MYTIKTTHKSIKTDELIKNYYDKEKIENFCKQCEKYNKIWSCPPYDFDTEQYVRQFEYIHIIGTQIIFDKTTIEEVNTIENIKKFSIGTILKERKKIFDKLLLLESKYPGSKAINAGNCSICEKCTRVNNRKCINESLIRYSLESLGFDVAKITSEILGIELKWSSETLPEYLTMASGFMTT
ncbi:DUF2284 domain-containing protein [Sedimentibacter sp. MB31-C6]|uniref:DUF2284 domain-containing protein n=1 Tax=Sedimentibacter sp. MB31-C6 TaxID=3109366 RepID=UPI002DDCAC13|nr:DUF2284 domain-containing protein [Sedimentibacter sp. MB36-C1]WSI03583.1 DUF2284 domain-containing protein [Sedimentibacter sp. MB36-C1]